MPHEFFFTVPKLNNGGFCGLCYLPKHTKALCEPLTEWLDQATEE